MTVIILGLGRLVGWGVGWGFVDMLWGVGVVQKIESPDFRSPEVIGISAILIF